MHFVTRTLAPVVVEAAKAFPAVVLTGPRRAGKTTLLRRLFPKARYILLEDPDLRARAQNDPRGFLEELRPPVLFDEIQNVPELFAFVRTLIDQDPGRNGQWLFTGSQEAPLMQGVSESMAGRAAILQLLGLSLAESSKVNLLAGGFPEVLTRPKSRNLWFSSYLQTYLERDVRLVTNIRDLGTFRRFLALVASRHGQMVNRTDLAAPLGVSVPTITHWLEILEITGQIILISPYFENFGKRLIKSQKLYLADSGLACNLLGISSQAELERSPFLGAIFEGFVASEILKSQVNKGGRKELYFFRDQQGLEVDFVLPRNDGKLWFIECKASKTVQSRMTTSLRALGQAAGGKQERLFLVHRASKNMPQSRAVVPGVEALDLQTFARGLAGKSRQQQRRKSSLGDQSNV
jgi:predicted AAA+ superfamily ATPase